VTNTRLIVAIITTLLDDILILLLLFFGLPYLGIHLSIGVIIGIAVLWVAIAVFLYLMGSKILKKKPLPGYTDMVNTHGTVVQTIASQGMVKIKGELWTAKSEGEMIDKGEQIIVTGQNNMELTVRKYPENDT
jgi:membrane protein implicated in regulation of membrane protease activity